VNCFVLVLERARGVVLSVCTCAQVKNGVTAGAQIFEDEDEREDDFRIRGVSL
jgi:hypothetical protein